MAFRRGFKTEAEAYAKDFRAELGIQPHMPLCPGLIDWKKLRVKVTQKNHVRKTQTIMPDGVDYENFRYKITEIREKFL